ncbi:MAG: 23S rRNA (pseudouridine(1915)-N(3))-methyltransferase RlmH [Candidatus Gracilibacteria bacterium]
MIRIIMLGKLKESFWVEAEKEYLKRLSAFSKIEIVELREEAFSEKDSAENVKKKESEKILKLISSDDFVVALDEHGKQYSSVGFSSELMKWLEQGASRGTLTFAIGGPLGLDESVLRRANAKLSFSQMTFTHQMVRIFLLEQIYRGYMISAGRKYHY